MKNNPDFTAQFHFNTLVHLLYKLPFILILMIYCNCIHRFIELHQSL